MTKRAYNGPVPPGFDTERHTPVCEACARARAARWTCRLCGVEVCDCNAPVTYLDGGCMCKTDHRWYYSLPQINARLARLGLSPVTE